MTGDSTAVQSNSTDNGAFAGGNSLGNSFLGDNYDILTNIYRDECNLAVWQRHLPAALEQAATQVMDARDNITIAMTVAPDDAYAAINEQLGNTPASNALSDDVAYVVDMFCYLFDQKRAGLRLTALQHAMCPRFHVDKVPCRLVTTYQGVATEWLPHAIADRSKLGAGNEGKPDEQSGLFDDPQSIQTLQTGHIALLKGERWEGNEGAGLIHRSPQLHNNGKRLLLTLDFA